MSTTTDFSLSFVLIPTKACSQSQIMRWILMRLSLVAVLECSTGKHYIIETVSSNEKRSHVENSARNGAIENPSPHPPDLARLIDDFWRWRLDRSPMLASSIKGGDQVHDAELDSWTAKSFSEDLAACQGFLRRAEKLMPRVANADDKRTLTYLMADVATFIEGYPFKGFQHPITYLEGPQTDFDYFVNNYLRPRTARDYKNVIKRYKKFSKYVDEMIQMMKDGLAEGRTNHRISMEGVVKQCRKGCRQSACCCRQKHYLGDPKNTSFYETFQKINDQLSRKAIKRLRSKAVKAIRSSVQPAFRRLANFIEKEYLPNSRPKIGASSISKEYYEACLAFHTSTDLTAREIHKIGLEEVDRLEKEMRGIMAEMGHKDLSLREFARLLHSDPKNFYTSREELLAHFRDTIDNTIRPALETVFHSVPSLALNITPVPDNQPDAPPAIYSAGSVDGTRPGKFVVNTFKYRIQPKYEAVAFCLHEAYPGHHFQLSYRLEDKSIPQFMKVRDPISPYNVAPSRFPTHSAYVEGWGLYAEGLGMELGLVRTPLERYGSLNLAIWRACRLVVDTGIHALGWSFDRAVNFMVEKTALTKKNIKDEVTRYVTWPGQATSYAIGKLRIQELRRRAEKELGNLFNIKDFHEVVLKSMGPLDFLEAEVIKYIERVKHGKE